jgi:AcrR family transcriptional regulator
MARIAAADRRKQLLDAAFRVMARDGVGAATTRAIAAEADAPQATFHYCFGSRDELLRELMPTLIGLTPGTVMPTIEPGLGIEATLRDSLSRAWAIIEASVDREHVLLELTQYALRNPGLADLPRKQYEAYAEYGAEYARAVADATGVEWTLPIPVVSRMIVSFLDGSTLGWVVDRNSAVARAAVEAFASQLANLTRPRVSSESVQAGAQA